MRRVEKNTFLMKHERLTFTSFHKFKTISQMDFCWETSDIISSRRRHGRSSDWPPLAELLFSQSKLASERRPCSDREKDSTSNSNKNPDTPWPRSQISFPQESTRNPVELQENTGKKLTKRIPTQTDLHRFKPPTFTLALHNRMELSPWILHFKGEYMI